MTRTRKSRPLSLLTNENNQTITELPERIHSNSQGSFCFMRSELPIFPLQTVMFPLSRIPLHIFEERYKNLVKSSLDSGSEFGIVQYSEGNYAKIGCSVRVTSVTKKHDDGRMDIIVEGVKRFKLYSYEVQHDGLYRGRVEFLDEDYTKFDKSEMLDAIEHYNEIVNLAYKGSVKSIDFSDENLESPARSLCFLMAEKCGLSLEEKQRLLEFDYEQDRLDFIANYFQNIIPKLKEAERIADIIKSDGYLQ